MRWTGSLSHLLAWATATAICTLPWTLPGVGLAPNGLDVVAPATLTAVALISTIVAARRAEPPRAFAPAQWIWTLPLFTLLGVLPIANAWSAARSNGSYLLGVLPYSDAGGYVQGAQRLLSEGVLEPWSSRRPLNASLLATRLALVDLSVERSLVLQALLLALSVSLGARAVALDHGFRAGLATGAATMIFGAIYTPTTLSESLGISLGALSLALLWHAARIGSGWRFGVGMAAITVGLNARAGPFFALGTLLLWSLSSVRIRPGEALARAAWGVGGIAVAFGYNRALLAAHSGDAATMHGNFAYTLWGLAHGGEPWSRALEQYPTVSRMSEADASAFLYARALEHIRSHPVGLLRGLAQNVYWVVATVMDPLSGGRLHFHPYLSTVLFALLLLPAGFYAARVLRTFPDERALRLTLAASVGTSLSAAVIFVDGGLRLFAVGFPLGFACVTAFAAAYRRAEPPSPFAHAAAARAPMALFATLLVAAVALPPLARRHPEVRVPSCGRAEVAFALWMDGHALLRRVVPGGGVAARGRVPREAMLAGVGHDLNLGSSLLDAQIQTIDAGDTVVAALEFASHRFDYFVFPPSIPLPRGPVVAGCVEGPDDERRRIRRVVRVIRD